jgi:DNA mismatch repair protein MutH
MTYLEKMEEIQSKHGSYLNKQKKSAKTRA